MKNHIVTIVIFISFLFAGCSAPFIYKPPTKDNSQNKYSKVYNKPYDAVWDALINYSGSTFFSIDSFKKASGLLTLSFGSSNPQDFVTAGLWKGYVVYKAKSMHFSGDDILYGPDSLYFDGDYVEYLTHYQNGTLNGKMDVLVKKIDDNHTKVTVNARYVFSSHGKDAYGNIFSNTWSFNTDECSEVAVSSRANGTPPTITMCPTYKAENAILSALE